MRVSLIGGMTRLERSYLDEAEKFGVDLRIFNSAGSQLKKRLGQAECMILFTGKMSHQIRRDVMDVAKSQGIPVFMFHSCGVCTLRSCLECIVKRN